MGLEMVIILIEGMVRFGKFLEKCGFGRYFRKFEFRGILEIICAVVSF